MNRDRELDRVKASTFLDKDAAFLGCLMCNLNFIWTKSIATAGINNTSFVWNPEWFDSLSHEERKGVLMHELWHLALLHGKRGEKFEDHKKWNISCDIVINQRLIKDGYTLPDGAITDNKYLDDMVWIEERIYSDLPDNQYPNPPTWGSNVFDNISDDQVTLVQTALETAKFAGNEPGNVSQVLHNFLKPKLNWKQVLRNYLLDKIEPEWSWNRPNRRYRDMYLPSLLPQSGRLITVAMFLDTSGSISEEDIKTFITEVKYVKENLNPELLRVIQFDTIIQDEKVYKEDDYIGKFEAKGFGGTDYSCVREYILTHNPTVSIIFTDLYASEMEEVGKNKVIWIIKNNDEDGPFGESIHVDS